MRKILCFAGIVSAFLLCLGFNCAFAATSQEIDALINKERYYDIYGTEQLQQTQVSDAGVEKVNTREGNLIYTSTDLTLPGKGGFDFSLTRSYNSNVVTEDHKSYIYYLGKYSSGSRTERVVRIKYISSAKPSDVIYVNYDSEQEMFLAENGTNSITKNGIVYNRDLTVRPSSQNEYGNYWVPKKMTMSGVFELGNGWNYEFPYFETTDEFEIKSSGSTKATGNIERGHFYDPEYGQLMDYIITYTYTSSGIKVDMNTAKTRFYIYEGQSSQPSRMYKIVSFKYAKNLIPSDIQFVIERDDGVQFHMRKDGLIGKKTDRYNNTISYTWNTDKSLNYITDSYGRKITFGSDHISVNGKQVLSFVTTRENDPALDPNNYYRSDDKCFLTVTKGDKAVTYVSHDTDNILFLRNTSIPLRMPGYTLSEIILDTGGKVQYGYTVAEVPYIYSDNKLTDCYRKLGRVVKRQLSDSSGEQIVEKDVSTWTYELTSERQSIAVMNKEGSGYQVTDTYNADGTLKKRETVGENNTVIQEYTYKKAPEGNYLPTRITETVKDGDVSYKLITDKTYDTEHQYLLTSKTYKDSVSTENLIDQSGYSYTTYGIKTLENSNGYKVRAIYDPNYKAPSAVYDDLRYKMLEYDGSGNVIRTKDRYSESNNKLHVTTYLSYETSANTDQFLKITAEVRDVEHLTDTDQKKAVTIKTYDVLGNLMQEQDPKGNITHYAYDGANRLVRTTYPDGSEKEITYNDTDNIVTVSQGQVKTQYHFDVFGNEKAVYVLNGNNQFVKAKETVYDAFNRPASIAVFDGSQEKSRVEYTYHNDNTLKTSVIKQGDTVLSQQEFSYDLENNLGEVSQVKTTRLRNDPLADTVIKQCSDYKGNIVSEEACYPDADGNLQTISQQYEYNAANDMIKKIDFNGNTETYTYEIPKLLSSVTNAQGKTSSITYDKMARKTQETDFNGNTKQYLYNYLSFLTETRTPIEENVTAKTKYYYDRNGNLTKTEQQNNKPGEAEAYSVTENIYDSMNRLTAVRVNDGEKDNVVRYEYDALGNVTKQITGLSSLEQAVDPSVHSVTAYEYNEINKLSTLTDPLGATVQYTYDSLGNLKQTTDKKGTVIQYQYDGLGRMTSQTSSDETIAMAYNMLGKPTSITDGTGTTAYTYDGLSRLTKEEKNGIVKTYQYDPNGNRTLFQLNSNGTLELNTSYTYDELNRLSSVVNGEDETSYTYDFNGNLLSANTNNQSIAEYTYNKAGLLTAQTSKKSPTELLAEYSVQYYLNGNRSGVQETGKPSVSYVYDGMGRLSKETVENTSVTDYLYDSNQNRSQKTVQNLADNTVSTTNYTYNRNNWLLSEENAGVQKTYSYDANGNQTAVQQGENTDTFTYDSLNRMAKTVIGGTETTYTYDYSGLRQTKTTGGLTTKHIYDGKNIVMDEKSGEKQVYHRGLSLVSRTVNGGDKEYYSFNVHGDTAALFDAAGTITKNYDYDAFGNQTTAQENDNNPFRYCGEYFDNETNFIYLRNRYYDPSVGRFISEDPVRNGMNWYAYCSNNPINRIDPLGLFDYNTRLSYSQTYNEDVEVLQNELAWLGYLDMSDGGWGYYGPKTQAAVNAYKDDMGLGNTGKDKGVVGLQTWTSLGLIYRTQKDISVGVIISTIGRKQYKDVSIPINNALNRDKEEFMKHSGDFGWFASMVGDDGIWNLKYYNNGYSSWENTIGATFPGYSTQMILFGEFFTLEEIGNITYGYLGGVSGFSYSLIIGSVGNQFKNHGFSDWSNEGHDQDMIWKGYEWYKSTLSPQPGSAPR
ncbi:RHS repeat-associated core domain-containing protein [Acetivibrio sp. MSJd-27]|uniref:RHS repeat-associated core domain-containing protein n=1 Tax=Acetivibrio sp. MSJd-27 TaxID=2841523 RepID=UPI001C10F98A|nr:RHS repeat-associated core domain-containing protein [Acetivibrio sp. MSJd-27]MBU5451375.1 peptidoglycan-binding protein [Acetivibrio sp. MSJd-27]